MSGFRLGGVWAWVVVDADDDEAIPARLDSSGTWTPLIGGDEARMRSLRPYALAIAAKMGRPLRLIHFHEREELEVIAPPSETRTKH